MNETITVKLNPAQIQSLKAHYQSYLAAKTPPYAHYQVKLSDCTIGVSGSGQHVSCRALSNIENDESCR